MRHANDSRETPSVGGAAEAAKQVIDFWSSKTAAVALKKKRR